jgi:hypothetical protein
MNPRYRIVSNDGLAAGSQIIDLETGLPLKNVRKITLTAEAGSGPHTNGMWICEVEFVGVAVDVTTLEDTSVLRFASLTTEGRRQ